MDRKIAVSDSLREFVRHLPPELKGKIKNAFNEIVKDPQCGKPLVAKLEGFRSYKLGNFRIVYRPEHFGAGVLAIGPRKTVYEKAAREMRRQFSR